MQASAVTQYTSTGAVNTSAYACLDTLLQTGLTGAAHSLKLNTPIPAGSTVLWTFQRVSSQIAAVSPTNPLTVVAGYVTTTVTASNTAASTSLGQVAYYVDVLGTTESTGGLYNYWSNTAPIVGITTCCTSPINYLNFTHYNGTNGNISWTEYISNISYVILPGGVIDV